MNPDKSEPKHPESELSERKQSEPKPKLSELECDRKAMLFWAAGGKAEGQYPIYRAAVSRWQKPGEKDGGFEESLKLERKSREHCLRRLPQTSVWPWLTALISIAAVGAVMHSVEVNRESLQKTIEVQREQNQQQILKDYIAQITDLITNRDLVNKYPKNSKGKYEEGSEAHPDAKAASSLTKAVLRLLVKKDYLEEGNSLTKAVLKVRKNKDYLEEKTRNEERGALLVFLQENQLIDSTKPVISLIGADLKGANLPKANLLGANLERANLRWANLQEAYLQETDLEGANLEGTDFRNSRGLTPDKKADFKKRGAIVE